MVNSENIQDTENIQFTDIPDVELNWSSVPISEIIRKGTRLEASVFDIKGKHAREVINNCKWPLIDFNDNNGFIKSIYYPKRFKRIYIERSNKNAIGFLGSSEMLDINPKPVKFLINDQNIINELKVEENFILISRSGTIGNVTYVNKTLKNYLISEHAIRIICYENPGYMYAFLKSKIGNTIIKSNIYGAVVDQIEPEHFSDIKIPNPNKFLKENINKLILISFNLRDKSNDLIDEAQKLLVNELNLPKIDEFKVKYFRNSGAFRNYNVRLSNVNNRIDSSYHVPIINSILDHFKKYAVEVTFLGDERISQKIIIPGRFKRVYVEEGQGTVFFGGKQIYELDPSNKKYLSSLHHETRISEQLFLRKNFIVITCSGTIGKVNIVPEHWEGWTMNQHVIRVVPRSDSIAGYIYAWLSSDYGYELIKRFTYGAVVDEIDDNHVSQVQIPLLKNKQVQDKINDLVLEANDKRYLAYTKEQEALKIMNKDIFNII